MKITRIQAATAARGRDASFQLPTAEHTTAAAVSLFAPDTQSTVEASLAELLGETLYGVTPRSLHSAALPITDGSVDVQQGADAYRLRRKTEPTGARLLISGLNGRPADAQVVDRLTHSLPPSLLGRVYYWRRHDRGLLAGLLSDDLASQYRHAVGAFGKVVGEGVSSATTISENRFERRDALAAQLESLLSERREASARLEAAAADTERQIAETEARRTEIERQLQTLETELEEIETRLRYHSIAEAAEREVDAQQPEDWQPQLDEIEAEINRWRATLADLEHRESVLRSELTQVHPDDGSPALPLADQRAALAVAERLTRDIESEVARLARAAGSNACVCRDAHPRLNPLVDTLGQQLRRLAELADQQQRAVRVQELQAEAEHVARSQQDLRQQLDHLLRRRQELWRSGRPRRDSAALPEEGLDLESLADHRRSLEQQIASLRGELDPLLAELENLRHQKESIARERSGLLSDSRLEALQRELEEAQRELHVTTTNRIADQLPASEVLQGGNGRWRASELFAKLTDGRFRGLRLIAGGRDLAAIDWQGHERNSQSLGDQDRDLAAVSLMLAMAAGLSARGVSLPLVFDEPFAMLDDRHAAIFANLLDDFAHAGHQVLVFTNRSEAISRFAALGVLPLRAMVDTPVEQTVVVENFVRPPVVVETAPMPQRVEPIVTTKTKTITREYLLDPDDPIERFPAAMANRESVFARGRVRTVSDLLSADPSALAEELDRDDVTAELVALWQTHLSFVCFVPNMSFDDAVLLAHAGYYSPEDLAEADADTLYASLRTSLDSEFGARLRSKGYTLDSERASRFRSRARRGVERWRSNRHWDGWSRNRGERRQRVSDNASRRRNGSSVSRSSSSQSSERGSRLRLRTERSSRSSSSTNGSRRERTKRSTTTETKSSKRRFYLEVGSPIVDAPSIGPKTAIRFERAGVHTVNDLIEADAAALAEAIDARHIDAEKIVAWQHQAQLVCRIPQLRGHDAQILVACGFTAPEEIASMKPSELLEFVEPFCATSEGQRVLRSGSPPDLEEVTNWIAWARESRVLGAA